MERRTIRTYARRERVLNKAQVARFDRLFERHAIRIDDPRLGKAYLHALFDNDNAGKLVLDIGFGYGESLIALASEQQEVNFLGIEVNKHCISRCLQAIEDQELKNIKLLHYDAMEFIQGIAAEEIVSAVHLFFPDPWPKKRHHKRRFIQEHSIPHIARILKAGGYLYFVSDWQNYVEHTEAILDASSLSKEGKQQAAWWKPSAYEKKAERAGRMSHHLIYRKSTK